MTKFIAFFCDPTKADIIGLGEMEQDTINDYLVTINWNDYLQKSIDAKIDEIYYHPTFEVKSEENKNGLCISAIGEPNNYRFKITFIRPKRVKSIFGLNDKINENYSTGIQAQTKDEVMDCLKAYLRDDTIYLTNKFD